MYSIFSSHKVNIHFLFECINNLLKILIEHISLHSLRLTQRTKFKPKNASNLHLIIPEFHSSFVFS